MTFRLQVLSAASDMRQIAAAWEMLAVAANHPVSGPTWYENACRFVHPPSDRPHIIALWDEDRLEALAPLILTGAAGRRRYEIIGTRALYEPAIMLARTERAAAELGGAVASLKHPVTLTRLGATSRFNDSFMRRARRMGLVFSPVASGSPYVELSQDWESYYGRLPSRLKNVIRRGNRQLSKMGCLEFEFIKPQVGEVRKLLGQAFEVELKSWKGRSGSAVLLRPDLQAFFFHYGEDLARRGELLVSFVRLNGEPVAMQVANVSFDAYWQLKIGYDEGHAKQVVGLQLQLETIKWSCQQGLRRYEFLGTAERWIEEWTSTVHAYRTMRFYPFNPSGFGALFADHFTRIRDKVQRLRRRP